MLPLAGVWPKCDEGREIGSRARSEATCRRGHADVSSGLRLDQPGAGDGAKLLLGAFAQAAARRARPPKWDSLPPGVFFDNAFAKDYVASGPLR